MRRADRLFQIVQYLRGGRLVTARTLGQRLEVSERTIYRDIADLQASGVPIDGEAGVGYLMREGYDMPPLMFNRAEIVALVVGARLIRAWGGAKMALAATEALNKIETMLPPEAKKAAGEISIHAFDLTMGEKQRVDIDRIEAAINARQVLKVHYADEEARQTEREIEPLGLYFWGKVWTLIGWCRLRNAFRMFRIDRMAQVSTTGEAFAPAKGRTLQDYLAQLSDADGHGPPPGMRRSGITP
jgi:predicted DNA-binding transcriptional regulator YafY